MSTTTRGEFELDTARCATGMHGYVAWMLRSDAAVLELGAYGLSVDHEVEGVSFILPIIPAYIGGNEACTVFERVAE